jgi:hypothetical protein
MILTGPLFRGAARIAATVILVVPAAARCEPEQPAPSTSTEMGGTVEVTRGDRRLSVTLKPTGEPRVGNVLRFELAITARQESFVFFPSLLKFSDSKGKPAKPEDAGVSDESTVLILEGATEKRPVSVERPPSGWNGVLMMTLYDHDGSPLGTWSDY